MSRIEEKLYLQHVFDAIDQVYQIRTPYSTNYEERLRHSLNKLLLPDWYKHHSDFSSSTREKSRSQGQVHHSIDNDDDNDEEYLKKNHKDSPVNEWKWPKENALTSDQRLRRSKSSYRSGRERVTQTSEWYQPSSLIIKSSRRDQMFNASRTNTRPLLVFGTMSNDNLQQTDSSSYASVNETSLSLSVSSYHTAPVSSKSGYETPTTQSDNAQQSPSSSISDLTLAEALHEDLDIVAISTVEENPDVTVVGMENLSLPLVPSPTTTSSLNSEISPSSDSRLNENLHWYDDGSIETCIHRNSVPTSNKSPDDEVDMNGIGTTTTSSSSAQHTPTDEEFQILTLTKDRQFQEDFLFPDDPSESKANSSMMITNLDDLLVEDEDDDDDQQHASKELLNSNYRRPIQEDILYEVEHENSLSEHSQGTTNIVASSSRLEDIKTPSLDIDRIMPSDTVAAAAPASYPSLRVDTSNSTPDWTFFSYPSSSLSHTFTTYTPKIRQRHFSVGSYYDHRSSAVSLHPTHPLYLLTSAPVSPLTSTSTDLTYRRRHPSPISYGAATFSALRRVNPFFDNYSSPRSRIDVEHEGASPAPPTPPPPPAAPESKPKSPPPRPRSPSPPLPPLPQRSDEPMLVRPKTSRGRPPIRAASIEKESETISTDDDRTTTPHTDLKFIRGTIERVFEFHPESTSESLTINDDVSEENMAKHDDEPSVSLSSPSSKDAQAYPSVQAIQRFYQNDESDEKKKSMNQVQVTDLDQANDVSQTSDSNPLYARSHPANVRKKQPILSSEDEEVDDTLNDIEDEDSQDEKIKRQMTNGSSLTSDDTSPVQSNHQVIKTKKTSQETQTLDRQPPIILTTASPQESHSRSVVPPLDIVTEMVIERDDGFDDGQIGEIEGDMIIFYDDIEIVEHSSNISDTESESYSSTTRSSMRTEPNPPPPVPARTLKPAHLLANATPHQPIIGSPSRANRTYELEKPQPRKKIDINSMNGLLNRTDPFIGPTASHRLPSARRFVGKLNSDESSSRSSSVTAAKPSTPATAAAVPTPPPPSTMVKSQTLPLQTPLSNGTSNRTILNNPPVRSVSSVGTSEARRSVLADTNALVKQIQTSLSRNSLHDEQFSKPLSISTKDLRTFVSSTYSPSDENMIDDNGVVHRRVKNDDDDFKRQARLSKSFHNVSDYDTPNNRAAPSKSVERTPKTRTFNFPPVVASTSFSALPRQDDGNRMLSMKWFTGQVSDNSEIWSNLPSNDHQDLLSGYISAHGNADVQSLFTRLQKSNDIRVHAALDDIRLRVTQFDASKSSQDLNMFMRYLESRLRDLAQKTFARENSETVSIKSRTSSTVNVAQRETPNTLPRQYGRKHHGSSGNISGASATNGHQAPAAAPRKSSQSNHNQENANEFDDMLNTVLGLQKKGGATLPANHSSSSSGLNRDTSTPFIPSSNPKVGQDVGKRLFESGIYKDPRLIYDGPKRNEKEEQPLESSV